MKTDCLPVCFQLNGRHMKTLRLFSFLPVLTVAIALLSTVSAQIAKPVVTGKFLGDGKDGNIKHLVAMTREPFSDKPAIELVFTEKDPANSKRPGFDAGFKKLGSALIISVFKDGDIFGCEVAHSAHEKSPFSSLGKIKMKDFKVSDTEVSGILTSGGELETFGQIWEVDLTFSAPLPEGAFAGEEKEAAPAPKETPAEPKASRSKLPVAELPLPGGALDVEYKALVEQISFRVESPVGEVAADFAAKLKEQGWKETPGSLMGKTNAIINRTKDGADLTIMVAPVGDGCTIKVFAKGFDWSKVPASGAAKPAPLPDADAIEDEANRLLKDALKDIPGGF